MGRRKPVIDASARSARADIVLELYGDARCSIVVGATLADAWARARADWPNIDETYADGEAACVLDVDDQCVMLLSQSPDFDVFAHEALHVAAWVSRTRNLAFNLKNEEGIAYLVQWVVKHGWPFASTWLSA